MKRRGFTLIELLVVIGVLSVVSTLAVQAFSSISTYARTNDRRMELAVRAARVFEQMQDDFDHVISARRGGIAIRGESHLDEQHRYGRVPLESDTITLPIERPADPNGKEITAQSVLYHVERGGGIPKLICTLGPLGANPPQGAQLDIVEGIIAMEVEYFDGKTWRREWKDSVNPRAVRVALTLQDPVYKNEQISRQGEFEVFVP